MTDINFNNINNVFKDFPQYKVGSETAVKNLGAQIKAAEPDSVELQTASNSHISSIQVSDVAAPKKKGGIVAATLGTTILAAGVVALFLTKGFSSVTYRKVDALIDKLNEKIYDSTITKKSRSLLKRGSVVAAKGFKKVLSGMKSLANFNAIKDSAINKVFRSTTPTKKVANDITGWFKKLSYESLDNVCNKAHIESDDFSAELVQKLMKTTKNKNIDFNQKIRIKNVEKTYKEWLDELSSKNKVAKETFEKGFGKEARLLRREAREKSVKDIPQEVWDTLWKDNGGILNFKENSHKYKSYVTEDIAASGKTAFRKEINGARKLYTNNVSHNYSLTKMNLQELSNKLPVEDEETRNMLRAISKKMNQYRDFSGMNETVNRVEIVKEIVADLSAFGEEIVKSDKYSDDLKKAITSQVDYINYDILLSDKKGALQDLVTIMNGLSKAEIKTKDGNIIKALDSEFASKMDKKAHSITKKINKAATMESEDLYDKTAEFAVGSAPADIVGLLFPAGVAVHEISKADNKNEKVSATLTTGIPIVGSIGTMMIGTTKMLAGPKNLALSAIVGTTLSIVGKSLDKLYTERNPMHSPG